MSPSRPFILRPVATSLLMTGILLAGIVAYRELPVSALPEVDYPTIQVQTFYPGAGPQVMASSVTAPLERQFGQVPGLKQMASMSLWQRIKMVTGLGKAGAFMPGGENLIKTKGDTGHRKSAKERAEERKKKRKQDKRGKRK